MTEPRTDQILTSIRNAVHQVVERVVVEEVEAAMKRVDARIPEMTAEIGIRVQTGFDAMSRDSMIMISLSPSKIR